MDWIIHSLILSWVFCTFGTLKDGEVFNNGNSLSNKDVLYWFKKLGLNTELVESKNLAWYFVSIAVYSCYCIGSMIATFLKKKRKSVLNLVYNVIAILGAWTILIHGLKIAEFSQFVTQNMKMLIVFYPTVLGLIIALNFLNFK